MSLFNKLFGEKSYPSPDIKIGAQYGGGIIFFIDQTGVHGLIAAKSDMEGSSPGIAAMKGLSEGLFNWPDAVEACRKSETGGFRDWILPDKEQLNQLFMHKRVVGGFVQDSATYWSSSESLDGGGWIKAGIWIKDFSRFGNQSAEPKDAYNRVRAIRAF
ncbi:DUF1566 domain-containing protein [Chlorobium sp. KB01]|uniref:DUF1566 domain-containing protein n=1 Tax=Chlorobium sp. KB01 TaxID=1917528 RepID=UPI000976EF2F|nr:DUF1566 domain-containing protein [Chlorobium sp. KB01]